MWGSSPRMRGTLRHREGRWNASGIIPAYAGNTYRSSLWRKSHRDHPRVCGEHNGKPSMILHASGSSPRMRGTRDADAQMLVEMGIIPAYAGNTKYVCANTVARWDHPRVCGEHCVGAVRIDCTPGSSPRMRGTLTIPFLRFIIHGIIPAYAGNTDNLVEYGRAHGDHPRVCGEHVLPKPRAPIIMGSSPRMRGTRTGETQGYR